MGYLAPNIQHCDAIEQFLQCANIGHRTTLRDRFRLPHASEVLLWHGTSEAAVRDIESNGHLMASRGGFSGPGVYLTRNRAKAEAWARFVAAGRPCFDSEGEGFAASPKLRPALVRVSVPACLTCKAFDMSRIRDADFWYETYHRLTINDDMRPSGCWSGDCNETKTRPDLFSIRIDDELGRLVKNNPCDYGWFRVQNGLSSWIEEEFDSQYIPEMLPPGSCDTLRFFDGKFSNATSLATRRLMFEAAQRMSGDELTLRDGQNATYVFHEFV